MKIKEKELLDFFVAAKTAPVRGVKLWMLEKLRTWTGSNARPARSRNDVISYFTTRSRLFLRRARERRNVWGLSTGHDHTCRLAFASYPGLGSR